MTPQVSLGTGVESFLNEFMLSLLSTFFSNSSRQNSSEGILHAQIFVASERKGHKENEFCFRDLCVLLRLLSIFQKDWQSRVTGQQTIASICSQISVPSVVSCSAPGISLWECLRDPGIAQLPQEAARKRSADSLVREFCASRGQGCPRS